MSLESHQVKEKVEPLLLSVEDTARLLCISRPLLYQMLSDGRLGPTSVRFGRKRLFEISELRNWVKAGCPCREKWMKMRTQDA